MDVWVAVNNVIDTHKYDAHPYLNVMESAADRSHHGTTHPTCQGYAGAQSAQGGVRTEAPPGAQTAPWGGGFRTEDPPGL